MSKNKLNTLFNSIGDNAVNNENTSLDIIKEYLNLHNDNKLKVYQANLQNYQAQIQKEVHKGYNKRY